MNCPYGYKLISYVSFSSYNIFLDNFRRHFYSLLTNSKNDLLVKSQISLNWRYNIIGTKLYDNLIAAKSGDLLNNQQKYYPFPVIAQALYNYWSSFLCIRN